MSRPRLLDLFCCAGGAGMGYHQAGFDVVGVDIRPQPKYPFEFIQADCLAIDRAFVAGFDAIHASPPCQAYSSISNVSGNQHNHVDRIPETRALLIGSGLPYVIENVPGAPLLDAFTLCGTMFGLGTSDGAILRRHRQFETNWWPGLVPQCRHGREPTITVTGQVAQQNVVQNKVRRTFPAGEARRAMGIDWMAMPELSQAIPPAYTRWIGDQLLAHLASERLAA
jgi:DNA (cytosine-5)-methyltransferase 1